MNSKVCDVCEFLNATRIFGMREVEVLQANCKHPGNKEMFLEGFLFGRGRHVDTPDDCPLITEQHEQHQNNH